MRSVDYQVEKYLPHLPGIRADNEIVFKLRLDGYMFRRPNSAEDIAHYFADVDILRALPLAAEKIERALCCFREPGDFSFRRLKQTTAIAAQFFIA